MMQQRRPIVIDLQKMCIAQDSHSHSLGMLLQVFVNQAPGRS